MRTLIVDANGALHPQGFEGERPLRWLSALREVLVGAPADVEVAVLLEQVDDRARDDIAAAVAPLRAQLLRGPRVVVLKTYLREHQPDDYLILSANDNGTLSDHQLYLYERWGMSEQTVQEFTRSWLASDGFAGDEHAALCALGRELARIVDGTGMPVEGWLEHWLDEPHPVLGGEKPRTFMDTFPRRLVVKQLLGALASGAYM